MIATSTFRGSSNTPPLCYEIKWDEEEHSIMHKRIRDPYADWRRVEGHKGVTESYLNYIADKVEKILLEGE